MIYLSHRASSWWGWGYYSGWPNSTACTTLEGEVGRIPAKNDQNAQQRPVLPVLGSSPLWLVMPWRFVPATLPEEQRCPRDHPCQSSLNSHTPTRCSSAPRCALQKPILQDSYSQPRRLGLYSPDRETEAHWADGGQSNWGPHCGGHWGLI